MSERIVSEADVAVLRQAIAILEQVSATSYEHRLSDTEVIGLEVYRYEMEDTNG